MKDLKTRIADREQRKEDAKKEAEAHGTSTTTDSGEEGYDSWTVAELKAELDNREVEYTGNAKKAELVELLEANDAEG